MLYNMFKFPRLKSRKNNRSSSVSNVENQYTNLTNLNKNMEMQLVHLIGISQQEVPPFYKGVNSPQLLKHFTQTHGENAHNWMNNFLTNADYATIKKIKKKRNNHAVKKQLTVHNTARTNALRSHQNVTFRTISLSLGDQNYIVKMQPYNYVKGSFTKESVKLATGTSNKSALLTNVYTVDTIVNSGQPPLKSIRYGTPVSYKSETARLNNIVAHAQEQLHKYTNKRVIVLSLLDSCTSKRGVCQTGGKVGANPKLEESIVVHHEATQYSDDPNVQFIQLSCSSAINDGSGMMRGRENDYKKLQVWMKDAGIDEFFGILQGSKYALFRGPNDGRPFVRFQEFVALSIIRYYLHTRDNNNGYNYIYHCKSGKDRTGLIFALDQTVLIFCKKLSKERSNAANKHKGIVSEMLTIFDKLTSGLPANTKWVKHPVDAFGDNTLEKVFNTMIKRSFLITMISTGAPGLKWNCKLHKDGTLKEIQNPIAKLLDEPDKIKKWCGASEIVGS